MKKVFYTKVQEIVRLISNTGIAIFFFGIYALSKLY